MWYLGTLCLLEAPAALVLRPLCTGELQRQIGLGDAGKAAFLPRGNPVLRVFQGRREGKSASAMLTALSLSCLLSASLGSVPGTSLILSYLFLSPVSTSETSNVCPSSSSPHACHLLSEAFLDHLVLSSFFMKQRQAAVAQDRT